MMSECQANMQDGFFVAWKSCLFGFEKGLGLMQSGFWFFFFLFKQNCLIKAKEGFSGLHMWSANII